MYKYYYEGPVMSFGRIICNNWAGTTCAVSEAKARSNLLYQYKTGHGLSVRAHISIPGNLEVIGFMGPDESTKEVQMAIDLNQYM